MAEDGIKRNGIIFVIWNRFEKVIVSFPTPITSFGASIGVLIVQGFDEAATIMFYLGQEFLMMQIIAGTEAHTGILERNERT